MSQNNPNNQHLIRIFLSYTRADQVQVQQLYKRLQAEGFEPWMDTEDLLPGQKFEYHIAKAIRSSDFFFACLSHNSVNRRGVIQKEISEALDVLQEKLDEDIYLIPVRLEACEVPERLRPFHWADLHDANGFAKLLRALRNEIEKQHIEPPHAAEGQVKSIDADNSLKEWIEPITGMEFVWIPPGRFMMDATEADQMFIGFKQGRELPRREVQIHAGFWLGKYVVTQAQWLQIMGNNPSYFNEKVVGTKWGQYPVEQVSWNDCQEFLSRLRSITEASSSRSSSGVEMTFRLPSEAEGEYACRSGSEGLFYFGDEAERLHEYAWYDKNSGRKTHPVGQLQPNAWGLYGMHGNVWEWCADDWHDNYEQAPEDGSPWKDKDEENTKILRGGSWLSPSRWLRSADRIGSGRNYRYDGGGFRMMCGVAWILS
ncbi:hypothetical proteinC1_0012 [Candidatus Vecturithrix granuli]|uniref:TIR domain-containing protein n=1 Tax=Vecturithrix granuli TaxID=1499967 RepID=A0A081C9P3_VECG1|nr:hypothetical proteinC1_0012 [Candidatus Vecturithrix granuli]